MLRQRHPNSKIVGTHCPPIGFETNERAMDEIADDLVRLNDTVGGDAGGTLTSAVPDMDLLGPV
mgnify:CR=1 FL=1